MAVLHNEWLFDLWLSNHEKPHYGLSDEVDEVLDSLPEPHRSVLEARYFERLTYRDIAQRFTTSVHPGSGAWIVEKAETAFRKSWESKYGSTFGNDATA